MLMALVQVYQKSTEVYHKSTVTATGMDSIGVGAKRLPGDPTFFEYGEASMNRWLFFIYGVTGHLLFLVTYAYLAGFVGNFLVPRTIDTASSMPLTVALTVNLGLILLFGLQHSVMARPAFRRVQTRIVPQPIERSTYVLASCVVTFVLVWFWQGIDLIIWDVQQAQARALLWVLFAAGWLLVPAVSLMIAHF